MKALFYIQIVSIFLAITFQSTAQQSLFTEDFNPMDEFTAYPIGDVNTFTTSNHGSFGWVAKAKQLKTSVYRMESGIHTFNDPNSTAIRLNFKHICKVNGTSIAKVQYKLNGGSWINFPVSSYYGSGVYAGCFDKNSYSTDWNSTTTFENIKEEVFLLNGFTVGDQVQVQFIIENNTTNNTEGWLIDDIHVDSHKPCSMYFSTASSVCLSSNLSIGNLILPAGANNSSVSWNVNGIAAGTGATPTYTFSTAGTYTVVANLSAQGACDAMNHQEQVIVSSPNQYSISASVGSSCNVYSFDITPPTTTGIWSFGDGNFMSGGDTDHSYLQNGTYTAAYSIENYGCPIATTFSVTTIPPADFSTQIISECTPSSGVSLTINNFSDTQYNYFWDINGVIQPATSAIGVYTGFLAGTNIVKLKVLSTGGCQGEMIKAIYFNTVAADFMIPATACQGALCSFQNVVSGVDSYDWEVIPPTGSVQNYTGQYPLISFSLAGVYSIKLTVQSTPCASNAITKTITVYQEPLPAFTIQKNCGTVTLSMNQGVPSPLSSFVVNYGDGTIITTGNFNDALTHTYTTNGVFTISVTQTVGTCSGSSSSAVQINTLAGVAISGPAIICGEESIDLTAVINNLVSGTGGLNYEWFEASNPGVILSTSSNYTVTTTGVYKVRVTATGSVCFSSSNNVGVKSVTKITLPEVTNSEITVYPGCNGTTGNAVLTLTVPTGGYSINGGTITTSTTPIVTGLHSGTNYITLTSGLNTSCITTYALNIESDQEQITSNLTPPSCAGDNGAITITNNSNVATYNLYSSNHTLLETRNNNGNFDNLSAGVYIAEIVLENGCEIDQEIILSGNVLQTSLINSNLTVCNNGTGNVLAEAQVSFTNSQSTGGTTFEWFKIDNNVSTLLGEGSSQTLTSIGSYKVTAHNGSCSDSYDFEVKSGLEIAVEISSEGQQCQGSDVLVTSEVVGGTSPYSYAWTGVSSTNATASISSLSAQTTIGLTVTDQNGCTAAASSLVLSPVSNSLSLCSPNDANKSIPNPLIGCDLTVCAQGGTAPYVFEWYLKGEEFTTQTQLFFVYDNGQIKLASTNEIVTPPTAPQWVLDEYTATNTPVSFNTTYSTTTKYTKWVYNGSGLVVPRLQSDNTPFSVPITVTSTENVLQVSHQGPTTQTADFENGEYILRIIDSKGCEINYDPITIVKSVAAKPFPVFTFVFTDKEIEDETPVVEKDEELIQNMAEAAQALNNASQNCMAYVEQEMTQIYETDCFIASSLVDEFTLSYEENVYNYTLFYYDRVGQLTKTVPPAGVEVLSQTVVNDLKLFRKNGQATQAQMETYFPAHRLTSQYRYNGIGQMIWQKTEDNGESRFIYDGKGRMRFSQNSEQALTQSYSYVKHDHLGRPLEAGQSSQTGPLFTDESIQFDILGSNNLDVANDETFPTTNRNTVVYSFYTQAANVSYYGKEQRFICNNVSYVYKDEDGDLSSVDDRFATYYSYDPYGNVEWMIQEAPELGQNYIAYEYDLISSKVLKVLYNENRNDRFFHKYDYDAENRLLSVSTSTDGEMWDKDASYEYYKHGAFKRTIIGEDKVQGIDNLYTINGWLKAVNTPSLNRAQDQGKDGKVVTADWQTNNDNTAEDMFGMVLGYFSGDYANSTVNFTNDYASLYTTGGAKDLFNGNISFWSNSRLDAMAKTNYVNASIYRYDLLDRIKSSKNYESLMTASVPNPTFTNGYMGNTSAFETSYAFDANGNMTNMTRKDSHGANMDNLDYTYTAPSLGAPITKNRLEEVSDNINPTNKGDILGTHNYTYNQRGNITRDEGQELFDLTSDGINNPIPYTVVLDITWTLTEKVASIHKTVTNASILVGMEESNFKYDAMDMRTIKEYKRHYSNNNGAIPVNYEYKLDEIKTTYYVMDASSVQMAMYEKKFTEEDLESGQTVPTYGVSIKLKEQPIYGSSRVGVNVREEEIASVTGISSNENLTFSTLESGVQHISEYQNWITSASSTTTLNGGIDQICQCKVKKLGYDETTEQYIKNPTSEEMTQFLGISENGLAIAENLAGETQFYAILVKKYLGSSDACLIYDIEGNLMKGTEAILNVDVNSKPVIINLPGSNKYALVTLSTSGQPVHHIIDMDQIGYGGVEKRGEVIEVNKTTVTAQSNVQYGWHYTGYEDHINDFSIVYTSRYTPINAQEGKTEIVALKFENNTELQPEEYVVYEINGCGNTQKGELQISPKGDQLIWYQHGQNIAVFAQRKVDVYTISLNPDKLSASADITAIGTGDGGNVGRGMVEMLADNQTVIYSQRSVYQTEQDDKGNRNVWKVNKTTPSQISSINPMDPTTAYLYTQIRRGKDGQVYMPNMSESIQMIHSYNPDEEEAMSTAINFANGDYEYNSSLPTQVHKLFTLFEAPAASSRKVGNKMYELTDHLGNVRVLISDIKRVVDTQSDNVITAGEDYYTPEVLAYTDYDPFGVELDGRKGSIEGRYRYGFQGQERDDEIKGEGNSWNYAFRMHDPRVGRFFATDPISDEYPHLSPYSFSANKVISAVEVEGMENLDLNQRSRGIWAANGLTGFGGANASFTYAGAVAGLNYNYASNRRPHKLAFIINTSTSIDAYARKNNVNVLGANSSTLLSFGFKHNRSNNRYQYATNRRIGGGLRNKQRNRFGNYRPTTFKSSELMNGFSIVATVEGHFDIGPLHPISTVTKSVTFTFPTGNKSAFQFTFGNDFAWFGLANFGYNAYERKFGGAEDGGITQHFSAGQYWFKSQQALVFSAWGTTAHRMFGGDGINSNYILSNETRRGRQLYETVNSIGSHFGIGQLTYYRPFLGGTIGFSIGVEGQKMGMDMQDDIHFLPGFSKQGKMSYLFDWDPNDKAKVTGGISISFPIK